MSRPEKVVAKADKAAWQPTVQSKAEVAAASQGKPAFTAEDKALLAKQETVIASNVGAFLLLGEALSIIKGRNLQKVTDPNLTFDHYCETKWGFGQAYAYRLIAGYECVKRLKDGLSPNGVTLFPANEAQVRPLTSLPADEQVKAWSAVLKKAGGGNIRAAMVEEVASGSAGKTVEPKTAKSAVDAAARADHKKLMTIAKLVEKAKQVDPAELNLKKLVDILEKIDKILKDEES